MPDAIDVLFPLPLGALSYLPPLGPSTARSEELIGRRVVVPWQSSVRVGLVKGVRRVDAGRGLELRHALQYLDAAPWLSAAQLHGVDSIARGAGVPAGLVLLSLAVPGLSPELSHEVHVSSDLKDAGGLFDGVSGEWADAASLDAKRLELLRSQGLLDERVRVVHRTTRVVRPVREPDDGLEGARSINQRLALERLIELGEVESGAALAREAEVPESAVRSIIAKGYAAYEEVEARPAPLPQPPLDSERLPDPPSGASAPEGNGAVVGGLRAPRLSALVPLLERDLAGGRSTLVIAPENSLASEAAALLATRLPVRLLTGEADEEQRVELFSQLPEEEASVLVGSYIALLAPLPNLGRIVLLEASNGAYKLRSGARLALQKAATRLAAAVGAELTMTDVVASPELVAALEDGQRLSLPLPNLRVHVADLGGSPNWPLHPDLQLTLRQVAQRDRQAIVIAARRGYSAAFGCYTCGWLAPCPNCDLTLRYHRDEDRLRCHQCGHDEPIPRVCRECGGEDLGALRGAGTQWVASQLRKLLPETPVYRYDSDHRDDLTALHRGQPGVVAATTAALRLPPLPRLSLVAITLFDVHLALADFRAEQEAVRMLLQTAELAGGPRPLVVVQTYAPHNEALVAVASDPPDPALEVLLGRQLERRKRFGYPPFSTLAKVQLTARERSAASVAAQGVADTLRLAGAAEGELLGPESAPVARVKGRYAYQLLLRVSDEARLETLLDALPDRVPQAKLSVDVDPSDVGELLE